MPVTVIESYTGRKTGLKKSTRVYVIKGATSGGEALGALLAGVPSTVDGMVLSPSDCDVEEVTSTGALYYTGNAAYIPAGIDPSKQPAGSFSISFDISATTVHYNQAINHISNTARSGSTPRLYRGAINVDEDGTVNGVDVQVPQFTFTVNYTANPADITDSYVATVARMVGSVNDDTFKGFEAGELLLTRVSGSRRDTDNWDISFGFAVSENLSDFPVGASGSDGGITVSSKKGWDYLWCCYETVKDDTNKVNVKRVSQVNIEQVYKYKDYGALGLP